MSRARARSSCPWPRRATRKELPPCILVKSDGATLYATTDLATIVQRMEDYHPDKLLYVTDKRQSLHFEQVFRAARKGGISSRRRRSCSTSASAR